MIAVIDVCKTDKRRNQTCAKQHQQNRKPKISRFFIVEITQKEKRGEDCALHNADKKNKAARIEKVQIQAFDKDKINHR